MHFRKPLSFLTPILLAAPFAAAQSPVPPVPTDSQEPALISEQLGDVDQRIGGDGTTGRPDRVRRMPVGPPPQPWKGLFYNNDFSYKNNCCAPSLFGDSLKDMRVDDAGFLGGMSISFGGETRFRYMDEDNRLRLGGPGRTTYDLWRLRNYLDVKFDNGVRIYLEGLDASIHDEELPITPIDENAFDLQNGFIDLEIAERDCKPVILRAGRQELLFGSQRLVSPLDWSNTRRNFEGISLISKGAAWDFHAFMTRPVNTGSGHPNLQQWRRKFDHPDYNRTFSGVYSSYHGVENNTIDLYWLWLNADRERADRVDGKRHTMGIRWAGKSSVLDECCEQVGLWSWDFEGAYQFGREASQDVAAAMLTGWVDYKMTNTPWTPSVKGLFYWGTGDRDAGDNENNTFQQLFPLGHAYWGIIDNLSGQNLQDFSVQTAVQPTKKLKLMTQVHWFHLDQGTDVLYNVAGAPIGAAGNGTDVGNEIDLIANYAFNPNFSVQVAGQWFFYGKYVDRAVPRDDATQVYVQTQLRY